MWFGQELERDGVHCIVQLQERSYQPRSAKTRYVCDGCPLHYGYDALPLKVGAVIEGGSTSRLCEEAGGLYSRSVLH